MSFSQMVRGSLARESDVAQQELGIEPVAPEAVEEVLTDPIGSDIQTDVVADAADAEVGVAEMDAAADTATELGDVAETLEASTADGGEGVDEAASQLAVAALERCSRAYGIKRRVTFSKESFATKAARKELTLQLAREADDASKSLWARVVETAQNLWTWLKNFVAGLFDKRKRLATKAEALITKAKSLQSAGAKPAGDAKISYGGPASVYKGSQSADPAAPLDGVITLAGALEYAKEMTQSTVGATGSALAFEGADGKNVNPDGVGNVKMTLGNSGETGRIAFTKASAEVKTDAQEIAPLSTAAVIALAEKAKAALVALGKGEAEVKAAEKAVGGLLAKLKSLATGKEAGKDAKTDRGAILSKLRATSSLTGTVASVSLTVIDGSLTAASKSLAAHKAPAAKKD